ncbi:MAG: RNA-binding protein, partial [Cytophagales bacterium]|nr:RNA-binding protein [Armatimonadota bacterium]
MRIYVGGLPYSTTSDQLQDLFGEVGEVTNASVIEDKYSGQSRGFGFVEMSNPDEAREAIAKFNGYSLGGRALTVNEAKPREEGGGGRAGRAGQRRRDAREQGPLAGARNYRCAAPHAGAARRVIAEPVRAGRVGLLL